MTDHNSKWRLEVIVVHSKRRGKRETEEFAAQICSLVTKLDNKLRTEHPSINVEPRFVRSSADVTSDNGFGSQYAFAILDLTHFDEEIAFLVGLVKALNSAFALVCQGDADHVEKKLGLNPGSVLTYESLDELCADDGDLWQSLENSISQSRIAEELVYELWFPRDIDSITVVCPTIHDPGEFADPSSTDYTYLDNLGDTDALLEIMVFLSRFYPKAKIDKSSSADLKPRETKNNLVVIGGPGSPGDISNKVAKEMMKSIGSKVEYTDDCETMRVNFNGSTYDLVADLDSSENESNASNFVIRNDYGYFARFPNPLDEERVVVLISGIHTAGVRGASRAFSDSVESIRNFHCLLNSDINHKAFECHFKVDVLIGDVKVPAVAEKDFHEFYQNAAYRSSEMESPRTLYRDSDRILPQKDILQIHEKALELNFHTKRSTIIGAFPPQLSAYFHDESDPGTQLLADLQELNKVKQTVDNQIPIVTYLKQLAHLSGAHADHKRFFEDIARQIALKT